MKKRYSIIALFLIIGIYISTTSCKKEDRETNSILEIISDDINNKINTQFLTDVSTINLKIIKVIQLVKENELDHSTEELIKEIEENHIELNSKIKKIAKKNLIIIPDAVNDYSAEINTSNENRNYVYLVEIEKLLQLEKEEYELIKDNTQSKEIKELALKAIDDIDDKLVEIDTALNNY